MAGMGDLRKHESSQKKKGGSWIMSNYRPSGGRGGLGGGAGGDRGRGGGGGGRVGMGDLRKLEYEQGKKKPSLFERAMDYWRSGASEKGIDRGSVPASMMGGFGPNMLSVGSAAVPASRQIINQPVQTNLGAANAFQNVLATPTPAPATPTSYPSYGANPPSPEQAFLQSPFYAGDVPITSFDEEGNQVPMLDENGEPVVISPPEAGPRTLPDTYAGQLRSWRNMMAAMMGAGPRTLPDTWLGQQYRLWQQYNAPLQPTEDWWDGGGGGGGWWGYPSYGGGGDQEYPWWLGMVNWKIQ